VCSTEACKRRVLILYLHDGKLRCRTCHDLKYPSQREISPLGRAKRRTLKAAERIGINTRSGLPGESYPSKPHGMHHKTFIRLAEAYLEALEHWLDLSIAYNEECRVSNIATLEAMIAENDDLLAEEDSAQSDADPYAEEDEQQTL
jgi:hypothetical protein